MRKITTIVALAALLAAGCSVTGRVQVNPPVEAGQYMTSKGVAGVGPVTATLEFRHDF